MMGEVCCRLLGKPASGKSDLVWKQAASFLSGRIQGTPNEMPGRNPDMSSGAAQALRSVLGQM